MSEVYLYRFNGTMDEFKKRVTDLHENTPAELNEYIIKIDKAGQCRFGLQRCGYSGGYWYMPIICENNNETNLSGSIEYFDPYSNQSKKRKVIDRIGDCLLILCSLPVGICALIYRYISWIVSIIRKAPKEKTLEEKLDYLMLEVFWCDKL